MEKIMKYGVSATDLGFIFKCSVKQLPMLRHVTV